MDFNITVAVHQEGNWFVAKCLENRVASQGKTKEDALCSLKEALELYFEDNPDISVCKLSSPL